MNLATVLLVGAGLARAWTPPPLRPLPEIWSGGDLCLLHYSGFSDRQKCYSRLAAAVSSVNSTLYVPTRSCDAFDYVAHGRDMQKNCSRPWSEYFALPPMVRPAPESGCPADATEISNREGFAIMNTFDGAEAVPLACREYEPVLRKIRLISSEYTVYHIRRGDLLLHQDIHGKSYATVAIVAATYKEDYPEHPGPLLYMTDEDDPKYIVDLEANLTAINPWVTRADNLFPGCHGDNMCIYCNSVQLQKHASLFRKFKNSKDHSANHTNHAHDGEKVPFSPKAHFPAAPRDV